ncbi:MAG TPA: SRPBCC domain-containing protein [Thermoplasmata archaeon]|nr:SRPBCC domain-containing protein [Thermoplasmata archaeon]
MEPKPTTRSVSHQYFVRAPPDRVYAAFTDPQQLVRWLCDHAEIDLRPGGRYALGWTGGPTHTGTVAALAPGRSVSLRWTWPNVELEGTEFSLATEPKDDGALLRVDHTGFPLDPRWVDLYGGAEWGWTYFAMNLKSVLETGRDLRSPHDG